MPADFSGYATRANVRCSDGRTIRPNAFRDNDGGRVPLVWQHGHDSPSNILGHAVLENRDDGVYAHGYFNDTQSAQDAKSAVRHGDVDSLSIYANKLVHKGGVVQHGVIREVSLVLAGANPEAKIDNVVIKHGDGYREELDDAAVVQFGDVLMHSDDPSNRENDDPSNRENDDDDEDETVQDVLDGMNEKQRRVVDYLLNSGEDDAPESVSHSYTHEGTEMTHNIFERGAAASPELSHSDIKQARRVLNDHIAAWSSSGEGTLKDALEHAMAADDTLMHAIGEDTDYGINSLEVLFPEAQSLNGNKPEALRRSQEWVNEVLAGVSKRPFTRIKMHYFDMTHEEARARGYIRANVKKDVYFSMTKRETAPTTVYIKNKIDRDDIIDITTVDVVAWMLAELRISLNEEIARAILFSDGREIDDEDKIPEDKIRPIVSEQDFYAHKVDIPQNIYTDGVSLVDTIFRARKAYKGSGQPTLYTSENTITDLLLLRDPTFDKRHYDSKEALARAMNVSKIVEIDDYFFTNPDGSPTDILGIIVNLSDYAVGTDKGGQVSSFDDFDIDVNQYKYLLEGRMSGALVKPKSAVILRRGTGTEVVESSPLIQPVPTHEPTVPVGATYRSTGPKGGRTKTSSDEDKGMNYPIDTEPHNSAQTPTEPEA